VLAAAAVAVVVPAAAISAVLGFSNAGTPVPTASIFDQATQLAQAEQDLQFPSQVEDLGVRDGTTFYVTKNAAGDDCFALSGHVQAIWCVLGESFPSEQRPVIGLPLSHHDPGGELAGYAADGIARVALLDDTGAVVVSAPVSDNIYEAPFTPGAPIASLAAYDASGNVVYTHQLLP
jgi:hypothetical protein